MKRKLICMILSIAVVVSIMPFFTFQADAFSTGSKTLIEKTTVTIKPGKSYKTPVFKTSDVFCKCKFPKVASKNGEICISVLEKVAGCAA